MKTQEIKNEINKILESIPENALEDLLAYLKQLQGQTKGNAALSQNLRQILNEDTELLEKLAQ